MCAYCYSPYPVYFVGSKATLRLNQRPFTVHIFMLSELGSGEQWWWREILDTNL